MQRMNKVLPGEQSIDSGSAGTFQFKRTPGIIRTTNHRPLFNAFRPRSDWEPQILG